MRVLVLFVPKPNQPYVSFECVYKMFNSRKEDVLPTTRNCFKMVVIKLVKTLSQCFLHCIITILNIICLLHI